MTTNKILFATDFSAASSAALSVTAKLAHFFRVKTLVIHVFPYSSTHPHLVPVGWMIEGIRTDDRRQMHDVVRALGSLGIEVKEMLVEDGVPSLEIIKIAESCANPILVLGTHAVAGVERFVLGSTAEEILRHVSCPVITVGPHVDLGDATDPHFHRVLYATDLSDSSLHAAKYAAMFGRSAGATLRVLHVMQSSTADTRSEEEGFAAIEKAFEDFGPPDPTSIVEYRTVRGDHISQAITEEAEHYSADLLILGVHRASAFATHLGAKIAFQVIAASPCAVLTVSS